MYNIRRVVNFRRLNDSRKMVQKGNGKNPKKEKKNHSNQLSTDYTYIYIYIPIPIIPNQMCVTRDVVVVVCRVRTCCVTYIKKRGRKKKTRTYLLRGVT